jgi:hypothetical protein
MTRIILLCALLSACAPFQLRPLRSRPAAVAATPDCQRNARLYLLYGGIAAGASTLAGASGLSTLASSDDRVHLGLSITSIALGAVGAAATFLAGYYASTWTKC